MIPIWVERVIELIKQEIPKDFVGQVEVNVFNGGVSNVNVRQSFKQKERSR